MSMFSSVGKAAGTAGTVAGVAGLAIGLFWTWFNDSGIESRVHDYAVKYAQTYCQASEEHRSALRDKIFTLNGKVFLQANCNAFKNEE